ncbi:MAG: hypothetical protein L6Q99_01035 [Planctomycetes bacterium]|nr:hypothetical protein [Planctomycetota bacterium]
MASQLPPPIPNQPFGKKVVHFFVGLAALAILGSVGIVALGWGAKKIGLSSSGNSKPQPSTTSQDDRWARIEAKLQENEAKWQDAALTEFRSMLPVYAGGATPSVEHCTVLARSEDGKHLVAEAVWFDKALPYNVAPRVSSIALLRDRGDNKADVVQVTSCPRRPDLTPSRVQGLTQLVAGAKWTLGNF